MFHGNYSATRTVGSLELYVRYDGTDHERRGVYRVRVEEILTADQLAEGERARCYTSRDLRTGVDADHTAPEMVATLASFLSAAGEAYAYRMRFPDSEPENLNLFPEWLTEAAYVNSDELDMLTVEAEV
jgi:hypothetical protein